MHIKIPLSPPRPPCPLCPRGPTCPPSAGVEVFQNAKILYAPSKAANAGGVAVSGLEMSQNSARISWSEEELQKLLRDTMRGIHDRCVEYGEQKDHVDYFAGANIAGFIKVADAMLSFGHT